eukprot:3736246-Amphidinium_carterae.1
MGLASVGVQPRCSIKTPHGWAILNKTHSTMCQTSENVCFPAHPAIPQGRTERYSPAFGFAPVPSRPPAISVALQWSAQSATRAHVNEDSENSDIALPPFISGCSTCWANGERGQQGIVLVCGRKCSICGDR